MSVRGACKLRAEVLKGDLDDAIFAAEFGDLVADKPQAPKVYSDAKTFFRNTHPAQQLCKVVQTVFQRLAPKKEGGAAVRLSTGFGGGKTHTLMAMWHLASNIGDASLGSDWEGVASSTVSYSCAAEPGAQAAVTPELLLGWPTVIGPGETLRLRAWLRNERRAKQFSLDGDAIVTFHFRYANVWHYDKQEIHRTRVSLPHKTIGPGESLDLAALPGWSDPVNGKLGDPCAGPSRRLTTSGRFTLTGTGAAAGASEPPCASSERRTRPPRPFSGSGTCSGARRSFRCALGQNDWRSLPRARPPDSAPVAWSRSPEGAKEGSPAPVLSAAEGA